MRDVWNQVLATASDLAETELPNTQMAMLIFGEKIIEQIDFTEGQKRVAERLSKLRSDESFAAKFIHGRTALYDALLVGVQLLSDPTSADILYLVSDGGNSTGHAHPNDVALQLNSTGLRLFVSFIFGQLGHRSRTPEESNGPEELKELIEKTGGEMLVPSVNGVPTKPKEIDQFNSLMKAYHCGLIGNYIFEVEFSEPVEKHREWELKLSKEKREQWKNAGIFYPSELSPCEP
jgi:hypothetical protein